ncbi:hypothetical protein A0H81_03085 [Grifola frondosa]|uniref:Uncharacterized protein n=1 Tax=Grifola frondosa TaxID=5627 RepID=A0A1C7MHD3_GRIFR|nr:hypothetical protein A0H81_03085 [Grifola frondosa]
MAPKYQPAAIQLPDEFVLRLLDGNSYQTLQIENCFQDLRLKPHSSSRVMRVATRQHVDDILRPPKRTFRRIWTSRAQL